MTSARTKSYQAPSIDGGAHTNQGRGVILVGHGSERPGSGAAMIRLAARLPNAGIATYGTAAFLHSCRPTFDEALQRCVAKGVSDITVLPYFLSHNKFVREHVPRLMEAGRTTHPNIQLQLAPPLGDHPTMARLLIQRSLEADYLCAHPQILHLGPQRVLVRSDQWQPLHKKHPTALLMLAHGGPDPAAHQAIYAVAERVRANCLYAAVAVCFMSTSHPGLADAVEELTSQGIRHFIVVPYFLLLGNHVAEDLPPLVEAARERQPHAQIIMAEHLAFDRSLLTVIADRVREVVGLNDTPIVRPNEPALPRSLLP